MPGGMGRLSEGGSPGPCLHASRWVVVGPQAWRRKGASGSVGEQQAGPCLSSRAGAYTGGMCVSAVAERNTILRPGPKGGGVGTHHHLREVVARDVNPRPAPVHNALAPWSPHPGGSGGGLGRPRCFRPRWLVGPHPCPWRRRDPRAPTLPTDLPRLPSHQQRLALVMSMIPGARVYPEGPRCLGTTWLHAAMPSVPLLGGPRRVLVALCRWRFLMGSSFEGRWPLPLWCDVVSLRPAATLMPVRVAEDGKAGCCGTSARLQERVPLSKPRATATALTNGGRLLQDQTKRKLEAKSSTAANWRHLVRPWLRLDTGVRCLGARICRSCLPPGFP